MKSGPAITLSSPLSPAECEQYIESATRRYSPFTLWPPRSDTVTAEQIDFGYRLRLRRPHLSNSFSPLLDVRLTASASGAYVEIRPKLDPDVKVFMVVWFCFLSLMGGLVTSIFLVRLLTGNLEFGGGETRGMIIIAGMAILGVGMVVIGRRISASDEDAMLAFLKQLLQATETDAAQPVSLPWQ